MKEYIPNFSERNDEIGDLAFCLSKMTEALHLRIGAIESFAADVAHEIKNPLTSLRSAVETTARLKDPEQQRKLLEIIQEDVIRLDRLISDISDASRLDAELSREAAKPVNIGKMLLTLAKIHYNTDKRSLTEEPNISMDVTLDSNKQLIVNGIEIRLAQVFRNLIANAISFSPLGGSIRVSANLIGNQIIATIEDDGPGIPKGKEFTIFNRFYTQRRESNKYGIHSGLGLSISLQIINAHDGNLVATNRLDANGDIQGAKFTVSLPTI